MVVAGTDVCHNHSLNLPQHRNLTQMNMKFRFIIAVNMKFIAFAKVRRKLVECVVV